MATIPPGQMVDELALDLIEQEVVLDPGLPVGEGDGEMIGLEDAPGSSIVRVPNTAASNDTVLDEGDRPWYLKPDYPQQDLIFTNDHDDTIKAGTLPALIEHLTDHYRCGMCRFPNFLASVPTHLDQNFIRTFFCTFRSFSTVSEVFELLVARFHAPAPHGLEEEERKVWVKSKQSLLQVRVISIMTQLILDDGLFDPEEKRVVVQNVKNFALSIRDDVSTAEFLLKVANGLVRFDSPYDLRVRRIP